MRAMKTNEEIQAAIDEGLAVFTAHFHVGGSTVFLGQTWEDGGFSVDDNGNPKCDHKGNAVSLWSTRSIDPTADDAICREWYGE